MKLQPDTPTIGRNSLRRSWIAVFAAMTAFLMLLGPVHAAESLRDWTASFQSVEVQKKILSRIFPAMSRSEEAPRRDKASGMYLFAMSGSWVRLSGDYVWQPATPAGGLAYLVVSCMMYQHPEKPPMNATSYLFRNVDDKPYVMTAGYAAHERVEEIKLPQLGRKFLLVLQYSSELGNGQASAFMLELNTSLLDTRPRTVWQSPTVARKFKIGFDVVDGKTELLVLRVHRNDEIQYSAYRWNGDRFEPDPFTSDRRLQSLPESVWRHAGGQ